MIKKKQIDYNLVFLNAVIFIFFVMEGFLSDVVPILLGFFILTSTFFKKISYYFYFAVFLLFSFSCFVFISEIFNNFKVESLAKFIYPILFIFTGYLFLSKFGYEKSKYLLLNASTSLFLFSLLSVVYTVNNYGLYSEFSLENGRVVYNYLTGSKYSNTLINGYLCLSMCLIYIIFFKSNGLNKVETIFISIISFSSILLGLYLGNRSTFLVLLICMFLVVFIKKLNLKMLFIASIISLAVVMFFSSNFLIFKRLEESNLIDDSRTTNWIKGLEIIYRNPIGASGEKTNAVFAHNLWIDVGMNYGLLPMIILCLFSLINFLIFIRFFFLRGNNFFVLGFILSVASINTIFMIEPAYQGLFRIFCLYCMIIGMGFAYLNMVGKVSRE